MGAKTKVFFWFAFTTVLAVLIALIEGEAEVSIGYRIFQKIFTLYLNVLPSALVGYLTLGATTRRTKMQTRLLPLIATIVAALFLATVILWLNHFVVSLLPQKLTANLLRYYVVVALIAGLLGFVAIEYEIKKAGPVEVEQDQKHFSFSFKGVSQRVPLSEIVYVASDRNYCVIHCETEQYELKQTLTSVKQKLSDSPILQIHKQYLVNGQKIKSLETTGGGGHLCRLKDDEDTALPVGRSFLPQVRAVFSEKNG